MDTLYSPQEINQRRGKTLAKWLLGGVLLVVTIVVLTNSLAKTVNRGDVRVATVTRGSLQSGIAATGIVMPKFEETIVSQLDTHLSQVLVQAGQRVRAGQVLLRLDNRKIQLTLDNADESIALKNNQMAMAEHDLQQNLSDLRGQTALLQVDLESHQTKHDRIAKLVELGISSQHELKEAALAVKRTTIELAQLSEKMNNSQASTKTKIAGLALEKSILSKSRQQTSRLLASAEVKAPKDGLLVWLKNDEGSTVINGQALAKIADTSSYKLELSLSDFYANQVYQGMATRFDYNGVAYQGKVDLIIAGETAGALTLSVALALASETAQLRQRQRVDVNLITAQIDDTLLIDKGPYIKGAGLQQVFVINANSARKVQVSIGGGNSHYYQIKSGLTAGDKVIVSDVSEFAHLSQFNLKG